MIDRLAAFAIIAVLAGASFASAQDFTLAPTYGEVSLDAGFTPDPHSVAIVAGGDIDASDSIGVDVRGHACLGAIAEAPDYRLKYSADEFPLIFSAMSDDDTTLVINAPDGAWYCNDDGAGFPDPMVAFDAPLSGQYDIWIGTFAGGLSETTLYISELSELAPGDVATIEPAAEAAAILSPPAIFAAEDYTWRPMSQQTCLDVSTSAVRAAVDSFGLILEVFTETWFVEAEAADPNIAIMCLAEGENNGLVDPAATTVLAVISVYSTDRDLALDIRDFLEDWLNVESPDNTGDISWITAALNISAELGSRHSFTCPATIDPPSFGIWGTDVYTDDSSICLAAVHAGLISFDGGPVTIELLAGQASYLGSERNGVTSLGYSTWERSFRFVASGK